MHNAANDNVWGQNDDDSISHLLLLYRKYYYQYYVYVLRVIDDPLTASIIIRNIFLELWKMRKEIQTEELVKTNLFKLADIHCSDHYKKLHLTNDISELAWENIWGKSKEFLVLEKEIATIIGKMFEDGFFNPYQTRYYKDPPRPNDSDKHSD